MKRELLKLLASIAILFNLTGPSFGTPWLLNSLVTLIDRPLETAFSSLESVGSSSPVERMCLALALYHEARGEPAEGQKAVGLTIMNRVASTAYPESICDVVFQNAHRLNACQFSFSCDNKANDPGNAAKFAQMINVSDAVIASLQTDGSAGEPGATAADSVPVNLVFATHYHRHDVNPSWSKKLNILARIGEHVFFKSNRVVGQMSDRNFDLRAGIFSASSENTRYGGRFGDSFGL